MTVPKSPRLQRGQGLVEYSIVTMLAVLILVGNPNVILQLVEALQQIYDAFVDTIALSWIR